MQIIMAIAAGGAIGSVLRHFMSANIMRVMGPDFPYGTMTVNIFGSLVMGLLVGILARYFDGNQILRVFLTVGILGGFTTFSAFSLDTIVLIERGALINAGAYVLASVIFSIAGLWFGLTLTRVLFS